MRKKLIAAAASITGLALIPGCIDIYFNYGQRINLKGDDSGAIKVVYYISPNYDSPSPREAFTRNTTAPPLAFGTRS